MDVHYRPALPDDAPSACPLLFLAADDVLAYLFSVGERRALDFVTLLYESGQGIFSHHLCTVAEVEGCVVGAAAAFSGVDYRRLYLQTVRRLVGFYRLRHLPVILLHAYRVDGVLPAPRKDALYLECVGVVPSARGAGIGSRLTELALAQAREGGFVWAELDVSTAKPDVQGLWEKLGFRVVAEHSMHGRTRKIVNHRRMRLQLPPPADRVPEVLPRSTM